MRPLAPAPGEAERQVINKFDVAFRRCELAVSALANKGTTLEITRLSGDTRQLWFPVRTLRPTVMCFSFELPSRLCTSSQHLLIPASRALRLPSPCRHVYQLPQPRGQPEPPFLDPKNNQANLRRRHNAILNHLNLVILELAHPQLQRLRSPPILQPKEVKGPPQP